MIYHDFDSLDDAQAFLDRLRASGKRGYLVSYNSNHHQIRELS